MKILSIFVMIFFFLFPLTVFSADSKASTDKTGVPDSVSTKEKGTLQKHKKKHHTLTGQWKNNSSGSILIIEAQSDNSLTGTFFASTAETKRCLEKPLPVNGYLNRNIFSISINFSNCLSSKTVSMSGYLAKDDVLHVMTLVQKNEPGQEQARIVSTSIYERKN